eukprot:2776199-Amphidinium_carterae.1
MRNPANWSIQFNTPPVVLTDGSLENREDVRFRIGVEPVYSAYNGQGVPPGTIPHHYVSYYVSLHPNLDAEKIKRARNFRERKTPYADTLSDVKRPFDHPRDMPMHVVCNLEVRDLPSLPRNLDWCYPELSMYAQTGMFPLHFQKQLYDYYNESIAYMCDKPEDYNRVKDHFHVIDLKHGPPDDLVIPAQVRVDWGRWAHERTVNAGYQQEESQKWLLERDLHWKAIVKGDPPLEMRQQFNSPDGLFPQNWPEPDEPDEMDYESHLVAALVMDDYDNHVPSGQVFPNVPFRETLNAEGRSRETALLLGLQRAQLDTALTYAQERAHTVMVQANERFVRHVPSEVQQAREAREILLRVAPTVADVRTAAQLGITTTTMQVSIDPSVHPPVAEVSAPPFSGPPHKLVVETPNDSASSASAKVSTSGYSSFTAHIVELFQPFLCSRPTISNYAHAYAGTRLA